ncbi:MAG: glycoside hydrolase family 43 protein [Lachnospiraceae bacterium]|nr:glycoside hydrolase family 43 protein [Lachnospiraceae bacterium]
MNYQNPVLRGMYPDPSICRAGDKYYMVCSSFQYFPGVPLLESTDMINWKQIGNVLTRPSQIDLKKINSSGGVFAPTIRYHEGRFYMVTTIDTYHENFYVYTDDIYGEWSEPIVVEQDGIDPSLFFEDGRSYFISNGSDEKGLGDIQMCEIDIETGKKLTESKILWQGTGGRFLEDPHVYLLGEYYYLLEAEGGTEYGHMVNYARSKELWGPYEPYPENPVLTNRNLGGYPIQAAGHGDILEDKDGNWWFAHLAFRQIDNWFTFHHLGRETCVVPLHWREDGWFEIGVNGTTPTEVTLPDSISFEKQNFSFERTFANLSLKNDWIFLRTPNMEDYRITGNEVSVRGRNISLSEADSPSFAAIRQTEFHLDITCDIAPNGNEAGLSFYLDEKHHYELVISQCDGITEAFLRQTIGVVCHEGEKISVTDEKVKLHIVSDSIRYHFYISTDGPEKELGVAETRYLSSEVAGGFTGVVIGFYAVNKTEEEKWAVFSNFKMTHEE